MKRIASIADMHCGHRAGLTPTQYLTPDPKWRDVEEDLWTRYLDLVKQFDTPDILIVNGDCIDGRGERSGGTELIAPSLATQRDMAVKCIMQWKAPKSSYFSWDRLSYELGRRRLGRSSCRKSSSRNRKTIP